MHTRGILSLSVLCVSALQEEECAWAASGSALDTTAMLGHQSTEQAQETHGSISIWLYMRSQSINAQALQV